MLIHIALLALVSYWVSSAFGWKFVPVAVVLAVLYGAYRLAQHFGWFGMTRTTHAGGGGGISAEMMKFLVGFSTLTFVMMVGTKVIGVSNNFAFTYFLGLGPRPWLYPGVTTDLLIWVSLFFLSMVIAALAANRRVKPAIWIFGVTLVFLFVAREAPRVAEMARPKAATPMVVPSIPPPTTKWEEADQAASEGRGMAPVAVEAAKKVVVGDHVAKRITREIKGTISDIWHELFPNGVLRGAKTANTPARIVVMIPQEKVVPEDPEYPRAGSGFVKEEVELKAWLDPLKTHTRPSAPVRYELEGHSDIAFNDVPGADSKKWWGMPAGRYVVKALGDHEVSFRWYQ